jgi:hypothetical protein
MTSPLSPTRDGRILGKYRKVHVLSHDHHSPTIRSGTWRSVPSTSAIWASRPARFRGMVGMCICNDRRGWEPTRYWACRVSNRDARLQHLCLLKIPPEGKTGTGAAAKSDQP